MGERESLQKYTEVTRKVELEKSQKKEPKLEVDNLPNFEEITDSETKVEKTPQIASATANENNEDKGPLTRTAFY
ncbi:hypothetical protein PsorP6_001561 [Peronosclerospora sorghi]|uniref:Uncharacterized protein n=1 Tax=Peronosclerospora sorghi TaxID=230839 RepID=A0ACC0WPW1_9STRA|nr:hypothetical protein PsorP6_001561 [Peronosclerospora sorghi]